MRAQGIVDHQLARDFQRHRRIDAPVAVDGGQLARFGLGVSLKLGTLARQIGGFGIGL